MKPRIRFRMRIMWNLGVRVGLRPRDGFKDKVALKQSRVWQLGRYNYLNEMCSYFCPSAVTITPLVW